MALIEGAPGQRSLKPALGGWLVVLGMRAGLAGLCAYLPRWGLTFVLLCLILECLSSAATGRRRHFKM